MSTSSSPSPSTCVPGRPSTPSRSAIARPEHLEAAADPQHRPTRGGVREHGPVQPARAQPGEVGDGRPRAGQHDEVGVGERARVGGEDHVEVRLQPERVDVGEVADPRQPDDRHPAAPPPDRRPSRSSASSESSHSVGSHGSTPNTRRPVSAHSSSQPGREQRGIAAELVDHEARDQRLVLGREQRDGAEHRGEHPAAVDVADHDGRQPACRASPMLT